MLSRARALGSLSRSSVIALSLVLAPSADASAPAPAPCRSLRSLRPAHLKDAAIVSKVGARSLEMHSPSDHTLHAARPPAARTGAPRRRRRRLAAQGATARTLRHRACAASTRAPEDQAGRPSSLQRPLVHTSVRAARPTSAAATSTPAACTIARPPRAARTDSPERVRLLYRCVVTVRVRLPALTSDVRAAAFEHLMHSPLHADRACSTPPSTSAPSLVATDVPAPRRLHAGSVASRARLLASEYAARCGCAARHVPRCQVTPPRSRPVCNQTPFHYVAAPATTRRRRLLTAIVSVTSSLSRSFVGSVRRFDQGGPRAHVDSRAQTHRRRIRHESSRARAPETATPFSRDVSALSSPAVLAREHCGQSRTARHVHGPTPSATHLRRRPPRAPDVTSRCRRRSHSQPMQARKRSGRGKSRLARHWPRAHPPISWGQSLGSSAESDVAALLKQARPSKLFKPSISLGSINDRAGASKGVSKRIRSFGEVGLGVAQRGSRLVPASHTCRLPRAEGSLHERVSFSQGLSSSLNDISRNQTRAVRRRLLDLHPPGSSERAVIQELIDITAILPLNPVVVYTQGLGFTGPRDAEEWGGARGGCGGAWKRCQDGTLRTPLGAPLPAPDLAPPSRSSPRPPHLAPRTYADARPSLLLPAHPCAPRPLVRRRPRRRSITLAVLATAFGPPLTGRLAPGLGPPPAFTRRVSAPHTQATTPFSERSTCVALAFPGTKTGGAFPAAPRSTQVHANVRARPAACRVYNRPTPVPRSQTRTRIRVRGASAARAALPCHPAGAFCANSSRSAAGTHVFYYISRDHSESDSAAARFARAVRRVGLRANRRKSLPPPLTRIERVDRMVLVSNADFTAAARVLPPTSPEQRRVLRATTGSILAAHAASVYAHPSPPATVRLLTPLQHAAARLADPRPLLRSRTPPPYALPPSPVAWRANPALAALSTPTATAALSPRSYSTLVPQRPMLDDRTMV
ncbi:hypothetical protein B0H15DRAFT_932725, partial [Mycena belliarum]